MKKGTALYYDVYNRKFLRFARSIYEWYAFALLYHHTIPQLK